VAYPTKIVTCCYCGARAALVMAKQGRHELACSRCAAPLHDLKMLPIAKTPAKKVERELIKPSPVRKAKGTERRKSKASYSKRKKSKPGFKFIKDFFEDAFEFVEDAAEFVEDIFD
jgi:recombinational DNA repair protein (RecF pathway)